jgi:purine-binding chemotaxis protein CheW
MQSNQAVHAENTVTLGCFDVGGRSCALDVSQIREVVRWSAPTPLPDAPGLIDGVLDLRGSIVPVIDLGRALGLAVQAALEVVAVDVARLEDPPALATQAGYDLARAIVRRAKAEPMVVLSLEQVLERVYRSALADGERDR